MKRRSIDRGCRGTDRGLNRPPARQGTIQPASSAARDGPSRGVSSVGNAAELGVVETEENIRCTGQTFRASLDGAETLVSKSATVEKHWIKFHVDFHIDFVIDFPLLETWQISYPVAWKVITGGCFKKVFKGAKRL